MRKNDCPLILLTNDDGIDSAGLMALAEAAAPLGELLISAPVTQQTGMGRAYPRAGDVGIIEERRLSIAGSEVTGYAVHGSPALCVCHGVLELAGRKPDLCISGINYGVNMGQIATCSGTIGAAIEAASHGIASIAVSLEVPDELLYEDSEGKTDFSAAAAMAARWAAWLLESGMPQGVNLLNINVPAAPAAPEQYRITTQSNRNYATFQAPPRDRDRSGSLALTVRPYTGVELEDKSSDIYCVEHDRVISVTPLTLDMTARLPADRQLP